MKAVRIFAIALLTVSAVGADAQAQERCLKIGNDLDRLACYDKASGRTPTSIPLPSPGNWIAHRKTSALTDDNNVTLSVKSNEVIDCGWNNGAKITLILRCNENTTALLFVTDCHMASSDYNGHGQIDYRIDDQKARKVNGDASTDNKALGLWSGGKSIPVIKQMLDGKKLIARMTPFSESPFTATFDIAGLAQAIKPLRKECGW